MSDIVKQSGFNSLSADGQASHRAKIGVRIHAILGQFWQDMNTPDAVKAIEIEGWMDVLENYSHSEIRNAWRDYQTDSKNRTERGRLAKPDAGAIREIIMRKRPRKKIVIHPTHKRMEPRVTKEQADEIMRKAGFGVKRFGP